MRDYVTKTKGFIKVVRPGNRHSKSDTAFEMGYTRGYYGREVETMWLNNADYMQGVETGKKDRSIERI